MASWREVRQTAAWVGVVVGSVTVVSTYLPGAPYVPDAVWIVLFLSIFPIFGSVIIERQKNRPRRRWNDFAGLTNEYYNRRLGQLRQFFRSVPPVLRFGVPLLAVFLWVSMMLPITSLQGQPEIHNGRYFLDDHGSLIAVNRNEYENSLALQERLFASGTALFLTVAAVMTSWPAPDGLDSTR